MSVDPCLVVLVARRVAREVLLRALVLPSVNGLVYAASLRFDYAEKRLKANIDGTAIDCRIGSHVVYYLTEEGTHVGCLHAPELSLREDSNLHLAVMSGFANHRLRALLTAKELSQGLPSYPIAGLAYSLIRGAARTFNLQGTSTSPMGFEPTISAVTGQRFRPLSYEPRNQSGWIPLTSVGHLTDRANGGDRTLDFSLEG